MNIQEYITNTFDESQIRRPYSVMIGTKPSTGAKSPSLWNYVLKKESNMVCLDIPNAESVKHVFKLLEEDEQCLGGAVTAPYKGLIYEISKSKTDIAKATQATNNFYRNEKKDFEADNTYKYRRH